MLAHEETQTLCRVSNDTPMGKGMRLHHYLLDVRAIDVGQESLGTRMEDLSTVSVTYNAPLHQAWQRAGHHYEQPRLNHFSELQPVLLRMEQRRASIIASASIR